MVAVHEWSLAAAIVESVDKWARNNNVDSIIKVVVEIPTIAMIDLEVLRDAFNMLKQESRLANAELEVRQVSPKFRCRVCGYVFSEDDVNKQLKELMSEYGEEYPLHLMPDLAPTLLKCPRCGSHDIEMLESRIRVVEVVTK